MSIEKYGTSRPFLVFRWPCLMEDEGRWFLEGCYSTKEEAEAWIDSHAGQYFRPSDFVLIDLRASHNAYLEEKRKKK